MYFVLNFETCGFLSGASKVVSKKTVNCVDSIWKSQDLCCEYFDVIL